MDEAFYAQLLGYARICLPKTAFAEPVDIVNEAFLLVGADDKNALKRQIKHLAYGERGCTSGIINIDQIHFKDRSLVETSRFCKHCQQEKSLEDFRLRQRGLASFRGTICNSCIKKRQWDKTKKDPERLAKHRAKKRRQDERRYERLTGKRFNNWESVLYRIKDKIDADDWHILTKKLNEFNLVPESLQTPDAKPEPITKAWTHREVEFLYENHEAMRPIKMAEQLKRTTDEVTKMLAQLDLTGLK